MNKTIQEKRKILRSIYVNYHQQIQLLVGGRVRSENVLDIIKEKHTKQIHSSCKSTHEVDGLKLVYVDIEKVESMVRTLKR